MNFRKSRRLLQFCVPLVVLPIVAGCGWVFPPPEAALEGTWEASFADSSDLTSLLITFNANGGVTRIVYQIGSAAQVVDTNPNGTADVNGNAVTVVVTFNGNGLQFSGTFNSDQTVINGTTSTNIWAGGSTWIVIQNGQTTLTKQ